MTAWTRRAGVALAAALAALAAATALPAPASAHALRQSSSPDADQVLATPPTEVSISFGEEPDAHLSSIEVLDRAGHDHEKGALQAASGDPRTLVEAVDHLPDGVYTVSWRTVSAVDGHRAAGSFAFGVGVTQSALLAGGGGGATEGSPAPTALAVAARWLLYAGLILAGGAACVGVLVAGVRRSGSLVAAAGAGLTVAGTTLLVASQASDAGIGAGALLSSSLGRSVVERAGAAVALALAAGLAVALPRRRRATLAAAAAAAGLGMVADVLGSHAAAGSTVALNVVLQWAHVAAVAVWIGGLAALVLSLRRPHGEERVRAMRHFSALAGWALALVLVTGVIRAIVEIGSWDEILGSGYGLLVVAKAGLIALLAASGALNRWWHIPGGRLTGLRRLGAAELVVAGGAVLAASLLVNVAPPASARGSSGGGPVQPAPLVVNGADDGTSVRLRLVVSPGTAGFDSFAARVTDFDSGADVQPSAVRLTFHLPARPRLGDSTLALQRQPDGSWSARGANLSIDGVWRVTALVARGAGSVDVALRIETQNPQQRIDTNPVAGQPTIYTIHLDRGLTCQVYVDPQTPGPHDSVHATFFDQHGNGYPAVDGGIAVTPTDGDTTALTVRQLEPGHYVGDASLNAATYRIDISATATDGAPLSRHLEVAVPPSGG